MMQHLPRWVLLIFRCRASALKNLSVHHGSLFPASIDANLQISIYGIVNHLASELVQRLISRAVQQLA